MMIIKVGKKAVKDVKKDIENVYSKNKQLFFQLPDGRITQDIPKAYQK